VSQGTEACSRASARAGVELAGTATETSRWLLVEHRGAWGRDALEDTELPGAVRETLAAFPGRALLVRRPDRRGQQTTVFEAEATETGGRLTLREIETFEELTEGIAGGEPIPGLLLLVCTHGRRDACCARLGVPVFDALAPHADPERLWQSSHQGGHRFAANVLVLPWGVQLGRVRPHDAPRVAGLLREGRIPLDLYRGRALYPPAVQAAEVFARAHLGVDSVAGLELLAVDGECVTFGHAGGEASVAVAERPGPVVPASCGAEPEPATVYSVRW
jgi:hypothetical protein